MAKFIPSNSKRDARRTRWLKKHQAYVIKAVKWLNRREPHEPVTVYCMDWLTKNGANKMTCSDWGTNTKRQAIDKAITEEAREYKHFRF